MNSEQLITEASRAIEAWKKLHNTSCRLRLEKGQVRCFKWKFDDKQGPVCLLITPWELDHGFTSRHWKMIGNALFNLYNKEKACQAAQKP